MENLPAGMLRSSIPGFCEKYCRELLRSIDLRCQLACSSKLLVARAIENQCYVVGVNRVGKDDNGMQYTGHSAVIDPFGEYLHKPNEEEGVFSVQLDRDILHQFREKFPVLKDADLFSIGILKDPVQL